jgi:peptidoglycan/LPS O-acetylase OafA/YrhL
MRRDNLTGHILALSHISISFFFLLSGYILAMAYLAPRRPLQKSSFFIARFARIYPLYVITLLMDLPHLFSIRDSKFGVPAALGQAAGIFSANLLMLQSWNPYLRGLNFPCWSLSVEAIFYLLFPFLGFWLWRLKGSTLWISSFVLWAGTQLLVFWITPRMRDFDASYNPLLYIPTPALGILLARWQMQHREKTISFLRHNLSRGIAIAIVCAGIAATIYWLPLLPHENLNHGLLAPIFGLLILALSSGQSLPARMLSMKWLVVLGKASFGLYLIHIPVLNLYIRFHWAEVPSLYPTYLATCIGLSILSFYFVETPSRKWILSHLRTRPRETMEAASDAQ